ncbi:YrzE family protein [Agrococcus sp. SGAir0287]|uniref:YrzE family protein n=1 Tax=Agrococcus sp. SGAir0287 TaxID=2070347 RepID=UPI0010F5BAF2
MDARQDPPRDDRDPIDPRYEAAPLDDRDRRVAPGGVVDPRVDDRRIDEPRADDRRIDEPRVDDPRIDEPRTVPVADARDRDVHRDEVVDDHRGPIDRRTTADADHDARVAAAAREAVPVREEVVAREKQEFGGMQLGTAFFGWLTATGTAVLLTALVAGAGAALGLGSQVDPEQVADEAAQNAGTIGLVGAIAVLVILLVAYFAGGYVAGRMARFSGAKQGIAVWLWALVVAIVLAIVSAIAGSQWNVLANLNSFPRLPFGEGELTTAGIVTAVAALLVSLLGAVLGGLAGMRFHRKVDRVGLGR